MKNIRTTAIAEFIISCFFVAGLVFAGGPDIGGGGSLGTMAQINSPVPVANGGTAAATAADARTNLGLGTISTAPATDYTATTTFTDHTNDTSTHGVAQVANAADYLPLNGTATMTGNLRLAGGRTIHAATADASDDSYLAISGGGAAGSSRGAQVLLQGNENAGHGALTLTAGNDANSGAVIFQTQGFDRAVVAYSGNVGVATTTPVELLSMEASGGGYYSTADHDWHAGSSLTAVKSDIADPTIDPLVALSKMHIRKFRYKKYVEERHPVTGAVVASSWVENPEAPEIYGYLAEEVPAEMSKVIHADGTMGMRQGFAFLVMTVQAQQAQISALTSRVEALEAR